MLTQADLAIRNKFIGASEAAAILGVDRWKTPYDVWALKTGRCEDGIAGDAADLGSRLEPIVLDWAAEELGPLHRNKRKVDELLYLGATFDALTENGEPVEAKTSGLLSPLSSDWGADRTDDVPERVIIQAHVQMLLSDASVCYVPALLGMRGFQMFVVERDYSLIETIAEFVPDWWTRHVIADVPPEGTPSLNILKRLRRVPGKVAVVEKEFVEAYEQFKALAKDYEDFKDKHQADLIAAMGDAEAADFGHSIDWYTYRATTTRRFDVKAFEEAHPELYKQFIRQTQSRSLRRVKKPKAPRPLLEG